VEGLPARVGGGQTGEKSGTVRDPHLFFEIGTRDRRRLLPAPAIIYFSGFEHEAQRGGDVSVDGHVVKWVRECELRLFAAQKRRALQPSMAAVV